MLTLLRGMFLTTLAIASVGCGLPNRNVMRSVTPSELYGEWALTDSSLELIQRHGYASMLNKSHQLTLTQQGLIRFESVHIGSELKFIEGDGDWEIQNGNTVTISVYFDKTHYHFDFGITETNGQLVLWQFLGDPDLWEFVEYKRKPAG